MTAATTGFRSSAATAPSATTFSRRYDALRYDEARGAYRGYPDYRDAWRDDAAAVLEIVMGYNPPPRAGSVYAARRVLDGVGHRYSNRDDDFRRERIDR